MADVTLNIVIPDAHVATAISLIEDTVGHWELKRHDNNYTSKQFDIPAKGSDTNKEWGERVCRLLLKSLFQAVDKANDKEGRYDPAIAAIDPPSEDVPEDILG